MPARAVMAAYSNLVEAKDHFKHAAEELQVWTTHGL
jgi:hypothetical protein